MVEDPNVCLHEVEPKHLQWQRLERRKIENSVKKNDATYFVNQAVSSIFHTLVDLSIYQLDRYFASQPSEVLND